MWVSIAARLICTRETVHFSGVVCTAPEKLCTHMHPKNTSLIPKETQNLTTKFCIMQLSHEETTPALSSLSSWGWESGKLCGCLLPISTSRTSNTGENKGKETKKTYELSKTGHLHMLLLRGAPLYQIRSFFEHCSKSLWPPPPSCWTLCCNFFDGFLKKRVNVCRDKIRQNNA